MKNEEEEELVAFVHFLVRYEFLNQVLFFIIIFIGLFYIFMDKDERRKTKKKKKTKKFNFLPAF